MGTSAPCTSAPATSGAGPVIESASRAESFAGAGPGSAQPVDHAQTKRIAKNACVRPGPRSIPGQEPRPGASGGRKTARLTFRQMPGGRLQNWLKVLI